MKKIEEFKVVISRELGEFGIDIEFEDGVILTGHAKNILEVYQELSNILIEREQNSRVLSDDEKDSEITATTSSEAKHE